MFDLGAYLAGLVFLLAAAAAVWAVSVVKRDVSIVDMLWGPMFVVGALVYAWPLDALGERGALALALVTVWAARLASYIAWRNHGQGEDYRYREIRRRNEPHFAFKSLYLVFGLQAVLAWIASAPLLATAKSDAPLGALDAAGAVLVIVGLALETVADGQLAFFKRDPRNRGRVLDRGLWRYSRHPNYFGECCVWWGFACFAFAAGAWWAVVSPLLMTWLLLRVSGVALLEQSIGDRRPGYADYVRRTSAFVPWPPRKPKIVRAEVDL
jgi:steroid 5-alpha reductase family enzyme